ncbi:MAG TPA: NlpC/P60 family protein [Acidimicrobiales bacterium]|nr:NlpC/P60 family protein [Acidimicrobiales bacterium]
MTTCTWNFRRHASRVTLAAATAALSSGLVAVPAASADQISNLQARAAALAAQISSLGNQEEALSERYDQALDQVSSLQSKVADAQSQLASAQATTAKARQALESDALQAYMNGGSDPYESGNALQSASADMLRTEYIDTLATNQSNAIDQYHLAALQENADAKQLKQQESAAQAQVNTLNADRQAVSRSEAQLTSDQHQVSGEIAQLKAEQAAAEAAAARAAAEQRAAAAAAAQRQAALLAAEAAQLQQDAPSPSAPSATTVNYSPPPVGSGASGAVAAAESRLGDWYQWGATGPSTFDCSGLVMWAYEQVGISLPHYSGAQYSDTTHIPMSDLQPGDLVFFSDPGEHVAMYIGNGEIIEAPHTGAQVHIVPMYSEFTLAGRVS